MTAPTVPKLFNAQQRTATKERSQAPVQSQSAVLVTQAVTPSQSAVLPVTTTKVMHQDAMVTGAKVVRGKGNLEDVELAQVLDQWHLALNFGLKEAWIALFTFNGQLHAPELHAMGEADLGQLWDRVRGRRMYVNSG